MEPTGKRSSQPSGQISHATGVTFHEGVAISAAAGVSAALAAQAAPPPPPLVARSLQLWVQPLADLALDWPVLYPQVRETRPGSRQGCFIGAMDIVPVNKQAAPAYSRTRWTTVKGKQRESTEVVLTCVRPRTNEPLRKGDDADPLPMPHRCCTPYIVPLL